MKRHTTWLAGLALTGLLATTGWGQTSGASPGGGGGQPAGAGGGGAAQVGAAQQAAAQQAGAAQQAAAAQQTGVARQQAARQQAAQQQAVQQQAAQQQAAAGQGRLPQFEADGTHPWFGDAQVRSQLGINDELFSRMRNNYAQSWDRYNQSLSELQDNLAPQQLQQQQQRLRQQQLPQREQPLPLQQQQLLSRLRGDFINDQFNSANEMIQDPQMRQRFNQMYFQYLGPDAFNLPTVQQQLGLSPRQLTRLQRIQQQWQAQMQWLSVNFENDPDGVETFNQLRNRAGKAILDVLDEEQERIWKDLIGTPFDIPVRAYFPNQRQGVPNGTDGTFNGVPGAAEPGNPVGTPVPTQPGENTGRAQPGANPGRAQTGANPERAEPGANIPQLEDPNEAQPLPPDLPARRP